MKVLRTTLGGMLVLVVALAGSAQGAIITFGLVEEFSGATPPEGTVPPPWLTVTLDDGADATDGIVTLILAATNLTAEEGVSDEKVKEWLLNLDPNFSAANLEFSKGSTTGTFTEPQINKDTNAYQASGDGMYDIQFMFDFSGNESQVFGPNESVQYTVTLSSGGTLEAESFNVRSEPAGGYGPFLTAAHVQGIGEDNEDSGWVTVPEPASVALLAAGFGVMMTMRRRR